MRRHSRLTGRKVVFPSLISPSEFIPSQSADMNLHSLTHRLKFYLPPEMAPICIQYTDSTEQVPLFLAKKYFARYGPVLSRPKRTLD
jgi:hypothetical protein